MVFKNLFDKYYISQKKINTENGIVDNFKVKTGINYLLSLTLKCFIIECILSIEILINYPIFFSLSNKLEWKEKLKKYRITISQSSTIKTILPLAPPIIFIQEKSA